VRLLAHESLVLQDADTVRAALVHFRAKKALGFRIAWYLKLPARPGMCLWARLIRRWPS
jgi:hypothetical protein